MIVINRYLFDRLLYSISLFALLSCASPLNGNHAVIRFSESEHDFGSLQYQKEAEYSFGFSNPGKTALIIQDVQTSCGCTAAEWTRKPVKPGKTGLIKVKYDAAFPGVFHKEITVHYNGQDSPLVLSIKGQVEYPDSIQSLNK